MITYKVIKFEIQKCGQILCALASYRLVPIMLLKLPIIPYNNAPEFYPLCSNYAP